MTDRAKNLRAALEAVVPSEWTPPAEIDALKLAWQFKLHDIDWHMSPSDTGLESLTPIMIEACKLGIIALNPETLECRLCPTFNPEETRPFDSALKVREARAAAYRSVFEDFLPSWTHCANINWHRITRHLRGVGFHFPEVGEGSDPGPAFRFFLEDAIALGVLEVSGDPNSPLLRCVAP